MNPDPVWMDPAKPIPKMTQQHRDLMSMGLCPFCERHIRGWRPLHINSGVAQALAAMETNGIDHRTGHALDCDYKRITIPEQVVNVVVQESESPQEEEDHTAERVAMVALGGLTGMCIGHLLH